MIARRCSARSSVYDLNSIGCVKIVVLKLKLHYPLQNLMHIRANISRLR